MAKIQEKDVVKLIQCRLANMSPSTLRNQGAPGLMEIARNFLSNLNISELQHTKPEDYENKLDSWTINLMRKFPEGAKKNWGAARKALNVFMVESFFNRILYKKYNLERFKDAIETPLDSKATRQLRQYSNNDLPVFPGIKHLTCKTSKQYQSHASCYAANLGLSRAELDLQLWGND